MKCPHCGKETKGEKACEHCGKALLPSRGMEVQYKDFKVSELLDIRMPGQAPAPRENAETNERRGTSTESSAGTKKPQKKGSRFALTAVIIFLAAAAGFILLKLLLKF